MRIIATTVVTACLLLAIPSVTLAQQIDEERHRDGTIDLRFRHSMQDGEITPLTSTENLSVSLGCEVADDPVTGRHAVLATIDLIGPINSRRRAQVQAGGIGWTQLPGPIWRFLAESESPDLPFPRVITDIQVRTSSREFIHIVGALVLLDARPGFPCAFGLVVRHRGLPDLQG